VPKKPAEGNDDDDDHDEFEMIEPPKAVKRKIVAARFDDESLPADDTSKENQVQKRNADDQVMSVSYLKKSFVLSISSP